VLIALLAVLGVDLIVLVALAVVVVGRKQFAARGEEMAERRRASRLAAVTGRTPTNGSPL
jgi:hypothetical protein